MMKYTLDEFMTLMDTIEDDGGKHLDAVCEDRVVTHESTGPHVKATQIKMCSQSALFEVPYRSVGLVRDEGEVQTAETGVKPLVLCAVDDAMGRWPRYADAEAPGVMTDVLPKGFE